MTMTNAEFEVVNKIAAKTKADCWFCVSQTKDGQDYIYDLEENINLSLDDGIRMLMDCIDCNENYDNCDLSADEEVTLYALLIKLNIA